MQNQDYYSLRPTQANQLTKHFLFVMGGLFIWFLPLTHNLCVFIDVKAYKLLNGSLQFSQIWQWVWGILNHHKESYLNVVIMVALNFIGISTLPKNSRLQAFASIIYFWLFYQVVLVVTHFIFSDILDLHRHSPSLVIPPKIVLSETLNIAKIKVFSNYSFPAGHALVAIYWGMFSVMYAKPTVQRIMIAVAILVALPRLFTGAHWLSDVLFSAFYAAF
ncbi:MAG TPA: phosphatase PAP2 family protein, partial [Gammaproteobacteria bacterium]|nr:phosphatase PAP2 family protein [Gammaproteobacteria bacterium]